MCCPITAEPVWSGDALQERAEVQAGLHRCVLSYSLCVHSNSLTVCFFPCFLPSILINVLRLFLRLLLHRSLERQCIYILRHRCSVLSSELAMIRVHPAICHGIRSNTTQNVSSIIKLYLKAPPPAHRQDPLEMRISPLVDASATREQREQREQREGSKASSKGSPQRSALASPEADREGRQMCHTPKDPRTFEGTTGPSKPT